MIRFRTILEDYETRLTIVDAARAGLQATGKAEWERFGSGAIELKVRLRKLAVHDDSALTVYLNESFIGQIIVRNGAGKLLLQNDDGKSVPAVAPGDRIFVRLGSAVLFEGTFRKD